MNKPDKKDAIDVLSNEIENNFAVINKLNFTDY